MFDDGGAGPEIPVRSVCRAWDTARSRVSRIRAVSASAFSFSCCFSRVVSVPVMVATSGMTAAEETHSGEIRSKAKQGQVKSVYCRHTDRAGGQTREISPGPPGHRKNTRHKERRDNYTKT